MGVSYMWVNQKDAASAYRKQLNPADPSIN